MSCKKFMHVMCVVLSLTLVAVCSNTASAAVIHVGYDFFQTPAGGGNINVPGVGSVSLMGLPNTPYGSTDTIVQRQAALPTGPGGTGVIPTEMISLSLRSVNPFLFDFTPLNPFDPDLSAHAFVSLDPLKTSTGTLTVNTHNDPADPPAGTFDSALEVNSVITIRAVGNPLIAVSQTQTDNITSTAAPWTHIAPPSHPAPGLTGDFFPGPIIHTGPHPVIFPPLDDVVTLPDDVLPPLCTPDFPQGYIDTSSAI